MRTQLQILLGTLGQNLYNQISLQNHKQNGPVTLIDVASLWKDKFKILISITSRSGYWSILRKPSGSQITISSTKVVSACHLP